MTCDDIDERLIDFVEGRIGGDEAVAVRSHIDSCASCRMAAKDTRELMGVMEAVKDRQERVWRSASQAGNAAPPPTPSRIWRPGTRIGDFEILAEIGRGGMGVVFRARQVSLNRVVALKVMPDLMAGSTSAVARFQKEARAAAKLHHTNIVPVYAQGEQDGQYYYAMELVEGASLAELMRQDRDGGAVEGETPAAWKQVRGDYRRMARLMAHVADALDHAHRSGVLHRDIKPQNLLLGRDGELHVTDFGLATVLDEPSMTLTGEMVGTPAYMSPEQIDAKPGAIDHRTDVYSLGVTFYELLAGRRPFEGASREQLVSRIRLNEPTPPCKVNPAVPIDLDTICLRAMEKEPRRRYATAGEFAAELNRFAENRPIASRRVGWIEKGVKWVRRHPAMTTIVGLCLVLAVGSAVWSGQSARARHREADRKVTEAYDTLVYQSYRVGETEIPAALLAEAAPNASDLVAFKRATALCNLLARPDLAIAELRAALKIDPEDTDARYMLAWILGREDQREEGDRWLSESDVAGGPKTAAAYFFRAQALARRMPDEAVQDFKAAIDQRVVESKRRDFYQAMIHLARAHNHWTYHHRKTERVFDTTGMLRTACEGQPDRAYPRYLLSLANRLSGEIYLASGDPTTANAKLDEALKNALDAQRVEPASALGWMCEAEYWETMGDFPKALVARDVSEPKCKAKSELKETLQYRWRLHYWLDDLDKARADLDRLSTLVPLTDSMGPWYALFLPALLDAEAGRLDRATEAARRLANLSPGTGRNALSAACLLHVLGRGAEVGPLMAAIESNIEFERDPIDGAPPGWWRGVFDLSRGRVTVDALRAEAGSGADSSIWGPVEFLRGCEALGRGDRGAALAGFKACEDTFDYEAYSYLARIFAQRLADDPAWPNWIVRSPSGS